MFAYSSMVHAGFLLLGVIALSEAGLAAVLFYLATYAFSAFGGFALLSVVRDGVGREATGFESWAGLGRRRPLVGALFALFLLAFAGIPLTTGFVAKVRRVRRGRLVGRVGAGDRRRPGQRGGRLLLPAGDRRDVLHRRRRRHSAVEVRQPSLATTLRSPPCAPSSPPVSASPRSGCCTSPSPQRPSLR